MNTDKYTDSPFSPAYDCSTPSFGSMIGAGPMPSISRILPDSGTIDAVRRLSPLPYIVEYVFPVEPELEEAYVTVFMNNTDDGTIGRPAFIAEFDLEPGDDIDDIRDDVAEQLASAAVEIDLLGLVSEPLVVGPLVLAPWMVETITAVTARTSEDTDARGIRREVRLY